MSEQFEPLIYRYLRERGVAIAEQDKLREKNTRQGLALAQAEHELAQLQARRALVLDWCQHSETPVRYAEHVRTLLGEEGR